MIFKKPSLLILALLLFFIACSTTPTTVVLSVPRYNSTTGKAGLSWTANAVNDFKEYKVYRSDATGVDETATLITTITDKNTITYDDSFVTKPDKYYYYKVFVGDGSKTIGSNEVKLTGLYIFDFSFGSSGSGNGEFEYPGDVAVDDSGNIYVADSNNNRIQKFDSAGVYLDQWGTAGSADGEFSHPYDIELGPDDKLYVGDSLNHRVQIFDLSKNFLNKVSSTGETGDSYIAANGDIYVPDFDNDVIRIFDSSLAPKTTWGTSGSGNGQLDGPWDIAASPDGTKFYILEHLNERVQIFNSSGAYVSQFANAGSNPGQCDSCWGMAVDHYGYVYVTDWDEGKVQIYDVDGNFLEEFVIPGINWGIWNLDFDKDNNLYVVDADNTVVHVYGP